MTPEPAASAPMPLEAAIVLPRAAARDARDRWPWRRAAEALGLVSDREREVPVGGHDFEFRGCLFACSAEEVQPGLFLSRVRYRADAGPADGIAIALEAPLCHSEAEALLQAEHEAAMWVRRHQILPPLQH